MENRVPYLTTARRFIPWLLVCILIPLTALVIYVGWGREISREFWRQVRP